MGGHVPTGRLRGRDAGGGGGGRLHDGFNVYAGGRAAGDGAGVGDVGLEGLPGGWGAGVRWCRAAAERCVRGIAAPCAATREERRRVEAELAAALTSLDAAGDGGSGGGGWSYVGEYLPLTGYVTVNVQGT